jgi:RNA polymerase sigma-70 factor (ECF subfamily)
MSADGREQAWIRGAQAGRDSDVEALFRNTWPLAYRTAYLVVHDAAAAEDIAQEAFVAAIRNLHRFDARRPFSPWLHRIVVNRAIDWSRVHKARAEVGGEALAAVEAGEEPRERLEERVVAGLRGLPPEQRAVIVLRYLFDYTPGEIGDILELPRGTVNSRMRRGLDALRDELGEDVL